MAEAALADLPVLTAVKDSLVEEWTAFLGDEGIRLDCSVDGVLDWWKTLGRD